ncbi:DivIVA domain-containing protein [Actinoplanes sp. Pm04-4]|uniref:Cell wall synthesis protein Wag31 n=1 Tax=Paractinoplanes pyxinae TaxID=2997416 RepID=A0ABT4AWF9_9ACTN|nr:DivIVA domain-containing protein [Actinoplanes pyxinae]MCY1138025.1 DivIVA domain-containing protein [Actinoplanes pyxinae]
MPLTRADIHNREFTKSSLGRRGYDEDEVDTLLDDVTGEMIRLLEENEALRGRLGDTGAARRREAPGGAVQEELSAVTAALDRANQACGHAEQQARLVRRQLDEAHRSAAAAPSTEHEQATPGAVVAMARRGADTYLREAHEKSRLLLAEAHEQAERTGAEARRRAHTLDLDARRHHDEAIAGLETHRADLLQEMDELTRFAGDYHAALQGHLQRQEQLINGTPGP